MPMLMSDAEVHGRQIHADGQFGRFQLVHYQPLTRPNIEDFLAAHITDHSEKRDVAHVLVAFKRLDDVVLSQPPVTLPVLPTQLRFGIRRGLGLSPRRAHTLSSTE